MRIMFKKLLGDRVLLRAEEESKDLEKTEGGLFIPETNKEGKKLHKELEVVQVGEKCEHVAVGDRAYYDVRTGIPLKINGENYLVVQEELIVGVM